MSQESHETEHHEEVHSLEQIDTATTISSEDAGKAKELLMQFKEAEGKKDKDLAAKKLAELKGLGFKVKEPEKKDDHGHHGGGATAEKVRQFAGSIGGGFFTILFGIIKSSFSFGKGGGGGGGSKKSHSH